MRGLIYKDIFVMKQKGQILSLLTNVVMLIAIMAFFKNLYGLALTVVLSVPVGGSAFIQVVMEKEERTQFEKAVISLPVTKNEIILGRFITSFIYLGIYMLMAFLMTLLYVYVYEAVSLEIGITLWLAGFLLGAFIIGLNSVGYHLLGAKKGTFLYLVITGLSIIAYLVIFLGFDVQQVLIMSSALLLFIGTVITILCVVVCYYASLFIFKRKYS